MTLTWAGVIAVLFLALACVRGYKRGLIREIVSLICVFLSMSLVWFVNPYVNQFIRQRNTAVDIYSRRFAPLTIDHAEVAQDGAWNWILQPWPWEITGKGGCYSCGTMKRDCNTR